MAVIDRPSSNLFQVAYVSDDLERAAAWFADSLGAREFTFIENVSHQGTVVDGSVADTWVIDMAITQLGDTVLEIIRPREGALDVYREVLQPDSVATFHHIGIRVDSWEEAEAFAARLGRPWKVKGRNPGICVFGYIDTRAVLGHYIELLYFETVGLARLLSRKDQPAVANG